jgi:hypothetical protein
MKKIITKSRLSLNVGTLNWGFTVYATRRTKENEKTVHQVER